MEAVEESVGRYRLIEELGSGGMGTVYRALDPRLGREVALKLLAPRGPDDLERIESEARSLAALNHPGIVTVHSIEEAEGRAFLTMELVEGTSLDRLVPPTGLALERLLRIGVAVADALGAAHRRGVIHRDLKPANVIVSDAGTVKILDFGIAQRAEPVGAEDETADLGPPQTAFGTLPYVAPEVITGRTVDHRADLFALGVLLYRMACGRSPFTGATKVELLTALLHVAPRPLSEVVPRIPAELSRLVADCLEKDPSLRPSSAADVRNRLADLSLRPTDRSRSVAVLPFVDLSPEGDQGYFCDGLAEELIGVLARSHELRVVSRAASFRYRGAGLDLREVGRSLGADAMVEGSVRKSGRRIRVSAELVDVGSGYDLWTERFERDLEDVFALQDEIAGRIAGALRVTLQPGVQPTSTARIEAYDYYLQGRSYFERYGRRDVELALQMFERALERDPDYAVALAGAAEACAYLYANAGRQAEHLARADEASRQALRLAPDLAVTHTTRGVFLSFAHRHAEAEEEFETAIRLEPDQFEARYTFARDCFIQQKREQAVRLFEEAARVRPEDFQSLLLAAQVYEDLGRPKDAADARRRGVRRAEEQLELRPDDVRALYMGANGLVALGEVDRGLEWVEQAVSLQPSEPMVLYNAACVESLAGRIDGALTHLERAVAAGFTFREWLEGDGNLEPLRNEARFSKLLATLTAV